MSIPDCCFLTCIQISQEAGDAVWYSHLFKNFPLFVVIHTVQGFAIVNKTEVDVFLELSCFFCDPGMLAIWSLVPLPFLNPAWTCGSSWFTYCWNLAWRTLSIRLPVHGVAKSQTWLTDFTSLHVKWVQLCGSLNIPWHFPSLGLEWKLIFSSLWPLLSFPNLLAYWVQQFHCIIF